MEDLVFPVQHYNIGCSFMLVFLNVEQSTLSWPVINVGVFVQQLTTSAA